MCSCSLWHVRPCWILTRVATRYVAAACWRRQYTAQLTAILANTQVPQQLISSISDFAANGALMLWPRMHARGGAARASR